MKTRRKGSRLRMADPVAVGIDVGGRRKGFHAAALRDREIVAGPCQLGSLADVVAWIDELAPTCAAIDSPRRGAGPGETRREDERLFAAEKICGIRWTPDERTMRERRDPYYEWILHGFELYRALEPKRVEVIECFPTATWSVCFEPRGGRRRARWSREALDRLNLDGLPARRLNQDDRDAIAAAYTALLWTAEPRRAETFGRDLIVPKRGATRR